RSATTSAASRSTAPWSGAEPPSCGIATIASGLSVVHKRVAAARRKREHRPMFDTITVSDEEMDSLPDGLEGFLAFESLVRNKLMEIGKSEQDGQPSLDQRYSYFSHISEAADHFDIP